MFVLNTSCLYLNDYSKPKEIIIDAHFGLKEKVIIDRCIKRWNAYTTRLVGYPMIIYNKKVDYDGFNEAESMIDDRNVIYLIGPDNPYYQRRGRAIGRVTASRNDIFIFTDALPDKYFEPTVMHELGHWVGITSHTDDSLPDIEVDQTSNLMGTYSEDRVTLSKEDIRLFCLVHKCLEE